MDVALFLPEIQLAVSSNLSNVLSFMIASAWLPFSPMTALQVLVQNVMYDISQVTIPWDNMDPECLQQPRKWNTPDLVRFTMILGPPSCTIDMCTFALGWFYYYIRSTQDTEAIYRFRAHWFVQGLLTQILNVHVFRTSKFPIVQSRASAAFVISTILAAIVGFVIPFVPALQGALHFARPAGSFVGFLAAELLIYCIQQQIVKMLYIWLFKVWL
ncbi:uncharacterized protein ATNIH1004_006688 [Aspergillus tanneri]|uniref:Cation-transporting P-type ATPase C-terminal domain-containing protein n=1 Tax=Aspergillus tanneri TaxID=1220188 RepID=A0A5M9MLE4_9EURO|nr:uncharacterized protein ATNIH1004_006688 [Aspergillus tanneri]KAA8645269.1 hypothetical protein ATNIH1004_006688 [Aspergillus tanneri]